MRRITAFSLSLALTAGPFAAPLAEAQRGSSSTATPIEHVVVIFQENVSFDHYFGTYPYATNPAGEPVFHAAPGTPSVNGYTSALLSMNPNFLNAANGSAASNPYRLDRSQAATADQDHGYKAEQAAFDAGLMDLFPAQTGNGGSNGSKSLVMGYYDGNTVTALWNYAQRFAMNDNSYGTTFGPSTPGALNLVAGQTSGVINPLNAGSAIVDGGNGTVTLVSDVDPVGDVCSSPTRQVQMTGTNIGDLLNARGISWGWFEGGFDLTKKNSDGTTGCNRDHYSQYTKGNMADYIPHHEPFQYYTSTANPKHLRPSSVGNIGNGDQANHQYDLEDFYAAVRNGNMPAVSFLKASGYQDGHAGYSDPLDEQTFLVDVINFLQSRPEWKNTAVIINYDDSDGWYDHQIGAIVNQSATPADVLTSPGHCGTGVAALAGVGVDHAQGRCGYGPRLPLMVISPYSRQNFVDHTMTDQSSIIRFIEDNWLGGQRIGNGSFDAIAGPINNMFDFSDRDRDDNFQRFVLNDQTGEPTGDHDRR